MEMNLKQRQLSILVDYWAQSEIKILPNKSSKAWNATAYMPSISSLAKEEVQVLAKFQGYQRGRRRTRKKKKEAGYLLMLR